MDLGHVFLSRKQARNGGTGVPPGLPDAKGDQLTVAEKFTSWTWGRSKH
jgi:hypothetical protein